MLKIIKSYLLKLKHYSKINDFENALNSHPNYPSLLAITDSLTFSGVENFSIKVPFKHFEQLPKVFITELKKDCKIFYYLEKNDLTVKITNNRGDTSVITNENLEKLWTGVVLIIEENEQNKNSYNFNNLILTTLLLILGLFTIYANNYNILYSVFLTLSLSGVFISIEILKVYFEKNNLSETNFCNVSKKFFCNTTIKSKKYAFSKYIEFVDLPIVFFGLTTIGLVLSVVSVNTIGFLSNLSLPIVAYSIYIQKKKLKKWCTLCLLISLILISNTLFFWYFQLDFKMFAIPEIILLITIAILWFHVKKLSNTDRENKIAIDKLLRFKRNQQVFNAISLDVLDAEELKILPKIIIGKTEAPNVLSLFLSPSCPHCNTVFKEALDILEKNKEKLKIEIAYNLNINNSDNPYLDVAKITMKLFNQKKDFKSALEDWHINKLNIDIWKKKWSLEKDFLIENEQLEKQFQWCLKNEFNYTPVYVLNSKLLPHEYEIDELFYFFKEEN